MWNSQWPLELLKSTSANFESENLEQIQQLIDVDKYINSMKLWHDLCGQYAPFCRFCDKCGNTPCAVAYVKLKQSELMQSEIAVTSDVEAGSTENKGRKVVRLAVARKKQ